MSRPHIVRADTLDLQDQDAPSAKHHSKHPARTADLGAGPVAPHQASEIRQVIDERHSEEQHLQDAWNAAGQHLYAEPERIHEDQHMNEEGMLGGQRNGVQEETDGADADGRSDADDDMLDRISSSPSIDDGAYTDSSPTYIWPQRSSSLTPNATPTRMALNRIVSITPDSSSFVNAPARFPLYATGRDSPASTLRSSSPSTETPRHWPLFTSADSDDNDFTFASKDHHLCGGYTEDEGYYDDRDNYQDMESEYGEDQEDHDIPSGSMLPGRYDPYMKSMENLALAVAQNYSNTQMEDTNLTDMLLPEHDPLLEFSFQDASASPTGSSSSWVTDTDSETSEDFDQDTNRDDDAGDISYYSNDRFVDSGWGGECLRETEDIDFEFVYALHTFIATVEGQANATKGDTMVLLDDSNSYWWLVRVVKDSSIGYLPAEHIETPTERLARLNKHRNVDLSAAMLGDAPEKSKNPLKKAIRRRNTKTVQFAAPTYVEASDYDYDTEDEEHAINDAFDTDPQSDDGQQHAQTVEQEQARAADTSISNGTKEAASVEPERTRVASPVKEIKTPDERPLASPTLVDKTEAAPLKSRKGTPRNADSFLKDDTVETRKITLTPNLLRDDSSSLRSGDNTRSSSFESLEKSQSPPDRSKDAQKKKEKKPGMLSGLFKSKKKDKKAGSIDDNSISDAEKVSGEMSRQPSTRSGDSSPVNGNVPADKGGRQAKGKLSKTLPSTTATAPEPKPQEVPMEFLAELEGSQVAYEAPTGREEDTNSKEHRRSSSPPPTIRMRSPVIQALGARFEQTPLSPIAGRLMAENTQETPKKVKAKRSKQRVELDDFDDDEEEATPSPQQPQQQEQEKERLSESPVEVSSSTSFMHGTEVVHIPTMLEGYSSSEEEEGEEAAADEEEEEEEADDSTPTTDTPSVISLPQDMSEKGISPQEQPQAPEQTDNDPTPTPSKPQSPQPSHPLNARVPALSTTPPPSTPARQTEAPQRNASTSSSTTTSSSHLLSPSSVSTSSPSQVPWSDAHLRAWLDGENDIRDMLMVIHDRSGVKPVEKSHPLMQGLWAEEGARVKGLQHELDGLLAGWMGKRKERREEVKA